MHCYCNSSLLPIGSCLNCSNNFCTDCISEDINLCIKCHEITLSNRFNDVLFRLIVKTFLFLFSFALFIAFHGKDYELLALIPVAAYGYYYFPSNSDYYGNIIFVVFFYMASFFFRVIVGYILFPLLYIKDLFSLLYLTYKNIKGKSIKGKLYLVFKFFLPLIIALIGIIYLGFYINKTKKEKYVELGFKVAKKDGAYYKSPNIKSKKIKYFYKGDKILIDSIQKNKYFYKVENLFVLKEKMK